MKLFSQRGENIFYVVFCICNYFSRLYYHYWRILLPGPVPRAALHHTAVTVVLELDVLRSTMSHYLKSLSLKLMDRLN